ncbi:MAG: endopeptidase La, partial [Spirochaetes bacterium]|nr:endopeptidase La [Spirochaetota bacterium]
NLHQFLGPSRFFSEVAERVTTPGIATGLAWTAVGGTILFIEATKMKGKPGLKLTGQLGDIMKESANIALSYLHSNSNRYKIEPAIFDENMFHIHVPEGATPKDGPSAGITLVTALYSLLVDKKVKNDFAMTGEITLRGKVLPVGGIKEKVLAAKEAGISHIILSTHNKKDLEDIPLNVKDKMKFHFVDSIDQVLDMTI